MIGFQNFASSHSCLQNPYAQLHAANSGNPHLRVNPHSTKEGP